MASFRTKLVLHCYECGAKTPIRTEVMVCGRCGSGFLWRCRSCGHKFSPEESLGLCLECRWFICPICRTCGCDFYAKKKGEPSRVATHVHEFV